MLFKQLMKSVLPPVITDWLHRPGPAIVSFRGDYATWAEALNSSSGYDSPIILERTRSALHRVKTGTAVFERDSVILDKPEPPFPLLTGLLAAAAARQDGRLHVLDFGGSLGSTYYQCRPFLKDIPKLLWSVVEQPAHVICGKREFADDHLHFFHSITEAITEEPADVLVLSSVLPYLPDPRAFLHEVVPMGFPWIIVDRTFFHDGPRDRLTVQHVAADIYPANYPAWFFTKNQWSEIFAKHYHCVAEFPALDHCDLPGSTCRGMIYRQP